MKLFALLAVLLAAGDVVAQQYELTLEQCREMALQSNLALKSSDERVSLSEDVLSAYRTNHLPNFSLTGGYLYSPMSLTEVLKGGYLPTFVPDATGALVPNLAGTTPSGDPIFNTYAYMPDQSFKLEVGSVYTAGVQLAQPIYMGGKVRSAVKLAKIGVEVSQLQRRLSESEVLESVDKAFFDMLQVEEMLASAEKYESVVDEFHRQMKVGVDVGMKRRNDLLKVEVKLSEARLLSQRAENGLRLARMNLCYAVGLSLTTSDVTLRDDNTTQKELLQVDMLDISQRTEVALLAQQIDAKELEVDLARSEFLPSVAAVASYSYLNGGAFNGTKIFNSANVMAGVTANVPLFHWGEGRRKISAKRREVAIARNEMEDKSRLMSMELLQAINSFNESIFEVEMTQQGVAQAEENMRESRLQYEAGMETIADYLEAQALWQEALSRECQARAKQRMAYVSYLRKK